MGDDREAEARDVRAWQKKCLILFSFLLPLASAWWSRPRSPERALAPLLPAAVSPLAAPTPYRPGEEILFALDYRGQSGDELNVRLKGTLSLSILAVEDEGYSVWGRLTSIDRDATRVPPLWQENLLSALEKGSALRLGNSGFQLTVANPARSGMAAAFWRQLGERTRVKIDQETASFSLQETIDDQSVEVQYALTAENRPDTGFWKKSYAYARAGETGTGESRITWQNKAPHLREIEARNEEVLELRGRKLPSQSWIDLSFIGDSALSAEALKALHALVAAAPDEPSNMDMIQKQALGGTTWPELKNRLEAIRSGGALPQDLYLKLKAWVYLHPEQLALLLETLRERSASDAVLKGAIKAMSAVGSSAAQTALVKLIESRGDDGAVQSRVVTSLGFVATASMETQNVLEQFSEDSQTPELARSARMALGVIGNRQRADDPASERADAIEDRAWQLLSQGSRAEKLDALAMLGNIGPRHIDGFEPVFQGNDPILRGQAYYAMRFARDPRTPERLWTAYREENDGGARQRILAGISQRSADQIWLATLERFVGGPLRAEHPRDLARILYGNVQAKPQETLALLARLEVQTSNPSLKKDVASFIQLARARAAGG